MPREVIGTVGEFVAELAVGAVMATLGVLDVALAWVGFAHHVYAPAGLETLMAPGFAYVTYYQMNTARRSRQRRRFMAAHPGEEA